MVFKLASSVQGQETVAQAVTLDRSNMTYLAMDFRIPLRPCVTVGWDLGYLDGAGEFVSVESHELVIEDGPTIGVFRDLIVTAGNTYEQELQEGVFNYLQSIGKIGAGVVEAI